MFLSRDEFSKYIRNFEFRELFNSLGWDRANKQEKVFIDEELYILEAVAQKRGFMILVCQTTESNAIPDSNTRKKIERQVSRLHFENLIIFVNPDKTKQTWLLTIKEPNKPAVTREITYHTHQHPEILYQRLRGLLFTLDEEDKIGLVDVKERVTESFNTNAEKVTKRFYDRFKKEHTAFLNFIEGIEDRVDKDWYASLMLNRLMFIYFIQKKGFLDNNWNYLRDKLQEIQQRKGKNKFYSFYRDFLLVLFHKGLGSPDRDEELLKEIGQVPYLNGGLFDIHYIEQTYSDINIEDDAFEKIFDFFDQYNWHLDTSITSSGRDINPDVIGYIFEKYINDRAAMGAYYTKEDITHYIAKNCIIPYLFQEAKKECANAFREGSSLWKMLDENPDRYIYEALRHGIKNGLPEDYRDLDFNQKVGAGVPDNIAIGIDTEKPDLLERRKYWNTPAPREFALPTEIWREVIERRKRYWEVHEKIVNGEIRGINDFITYNLDIQQFAQDVVEEYEGSDLINAFYKAIKDVTVLDPTCGSGAFLFAALNILEPLYESCLERMDNFVSEEDERGGTRFSNFRKILDEVEQHPNRKYYVYKSIILNNLYGVDIMKEAVEIAKLRLFLKLVAEVDNINEIEPLPDIDFNIRSGNTLVGFATYDELQKALTSQLDFENQAEKFREEAEKVGMAFNRFKNLQLVENYGTEEFRKAKSELQSRLSILNEKLDSYLANQKQYGIDSEKQPEEFQNWKETHQPFHWFSEFYEIIHENGGFDVIIGNPPYVEYSSLRNCYEVHNYSTYRCGNLYAYISERCYSILLLDGHFGFIVQLSLVCTDRMESLQHLLLNSSECIWFANFDDRPAKLFEGIQHIRASIFLSKKNEYELKKINSTFYNRWYTEFRPLLFQRLQYQNIKNVLQKASIPKIGNIVAKNIKQKISSFEPLGNFLLRTSSHNIYFHNSPQYWIRAMNFAPYFWNQRDGQKISSQVKKLYLEDETNSSVLVSILNSSLFYWWFIILSDCRHLNIREIHTFPIGIDVISNDVQENLHKLSYKLMTDYRNNSNRKEATYKTTGKVVYDEFFPKFSKHIIDEIDKELAKHYRFTEEELDFIINYDINYRMGGELEATSA